MKAKLFKYLGLPCALVMLGNTSALADSGTGIITEYHLNTNIPGRGVCIQMNPTLPTVGGWLCLWKDKALYQEITDILREAYLSKKTCRIYWYSYRDGYASIDESLSCYN